MLTSKLKAFSRIFMICVFLTLFVTSIILAYVPGNYLKHSPIPAAVVSFIGMLLGIQLIITDSINMKLEWNIKKALFVVFGISLLSSLVLIIAYAILKNYMALATVSIWALPCILLVMKLRERQKLQRIDGTSKVSLVQIDQSVSFDFTNRQSKVEPPYDLSTYKGKFKCCCIWFLVVFISLTSLVIAIVASISSYYANEYQTIGQIIPVDSYSLLNSNTHDLKLRLNCYGDKSNQPTFIFEHGGGANGLVFAAIQDFLNQANIRSCSYDRAGYGKSEKGPNDDTPKDRIERLHQLLESNKQQGPYVLVGWSAGVQIIQTYRYYYENEVVGLVFIDGYPYYTYLEAINQNLTDSYIKQQKKSLISLLDLYRWFEPFGSGMLVGQSNQYKPDSMQAYYTAYYRNYQFWNSQYIDIYNPNDYTAHLTQLATQQSSPVPYNTSINLNWPNIKVPLLILASNSTVDNGNVDNIYHKQCLKYQEKASHSKLEIINAGHDMVYTQPYEIYERLKMFWQTVKDN